MMCVIDFAARCSPTVSFPSLLVVRLLRLDAPCPVVPGAGVTVRGLIPILWVSVQLYTDGTWLKIQRPFQLRQRWLGLDSSVVSWLRWFLPCIVYRYRHGWPRPASWCGPGQRRCRVSPGSRPRHPRPRPPLFCHALGALRMGFFRLSMLWAFVPLPASCRTRRSTGPCGRWLSCDPPPG